MGILSKITKLRRNRKFEYSPRYFDDKGKGNPFKLEHKFDEYRTTVGSNRGLKTKFNNVLQDTKRKGDRNLKIRMVVILSILILICLYLLDFDLSIFFS
ncbi:riboflavin synthase subunit beta [Costertonia aggregata]|uniref:Riboflavin synthase subunit beta n=1 Tax=Costertonia aggregata TaxID=343403 RepID=A0A7H9AKW0_9FLAO|nr:riboflavin synthase subunit beta [Costertonia aggregata]QLG44090.1 riboflavin synthase subunit beta [Costertonia aggregata]